MRAMNADGISPRQGIMAAHLEPAYEGHQHVGLPVTEWLTRNSLILPLYDTMTGNDQERVVAVLSRLAETAGRPGLADITAAGGALDDGDRWSGPDSPGRPGAATLPDRGQGTRRVRPCLRGNLVHSRPGSRAFREGVRRLLRRRPLRRRRQRHRCHRACIARQWHWRRRRSDPARQHLRRDSGGRRPGRCDTDARRLRRGLPRRRRRRVGHRHITHAGDDPGSPVRPTRAHEGLSDVLPSDVLVIEDAAQAQGAAHAGQRAGSFGVAAATSFYPGKNLGAYGDAGAVLTDDDEMAERLRRLRSHGGVRKYEHRDVGVNSRLDGLQAVVLSAKLAVLDAWNAERRAAAVLYDELLADLLRWFGRARGLETSMCGTFTSRGCRTGTRCWPHSTRRGSARAFTTRHQCICCPPSSISVTGAASSRFPRALPTRSCPCRSTPESRPNNSCVLWRWFGLSAARHVARQPRSQPSTQ